MAKKVQAKMGLLMMVVTNSHQRQRPVTAPNGGNGQKLQIDSPGAGAGVGGSYAIELEQP